MTTPGLRDLAETLAQLIEQSGLSNGEVARRASVDVATVGRWANVKNRHLPDPDKFGQVIAAVAATGLVDADLAHDVRELFEAIRAGKAYRVVLLRSSSRLAQERFGEYEEGARRIATFMLAAVPGLLQTEAYARRVFSAGGQTGARLEESVRSRIEHRQAMMHGSDREYVQIMTEGALRWPALPAIAMAEQVEHISREARADTGGRVRIGIVPWHAQVDFFPRTGFDLYDDTKAAIIGTNFGVAFLDKPGDVATYTQQLQQLGELAVFGEAAAAEFDRIAADYRRLEAASA